jgi:predicted transcriptional regulator
LIASEEVRQMKRNVRIEIRNEKESAQDFVNAWHRAQKGMAPEQPVDRIYFKDLNTLLRVLTPRRMEAIKAVHDNGPVSFRALAKFLGRDYKNVHKDMQEMERIGIVVRDKKGLLVVPWQRIIAELALAA